MKKTNGFTLIELVVVIVILGILAVTAAPKFLNLQSDARISALHGLKGAIVGANNIVYGKASIEGLEKQENAELSSGIRIASGYFTADGDGIVSAVDGLTGVGEAGDWDEGLDDGDGIYVVTFKSTPSLDGEVKKIQDTECFLLYQQATSQATPAVTVTESGC